MSVEELVDRIINIIQDTTTTLTPGITILIGLGAAAGFYLLVRYLLLGIILRRLAPKKGSWIEKIIAARIPQLLTLLVPPLVIGAILPYFSLDANNPSINILSRLLAAYVGFVITLILNGALQAINAYYNSLETARTFPISSILDVVRAVLYVLAAVVIVSILFDIPSIYILTAIGALIAAATVVFNNLILAFVAGLILTSKKMVVIGDWIEVPELQVSGEVREITLTTVIVQNLDHTIGAVPSAYLLTNSFKNWRGTLETGARLMQCSVYFDLDSIQPVTDELAADISSLPHSADMSRFREPVELHGSNRRTATGEPSASTNLGWFRDYCAFFLNNHPSISPQHLVSASIGAPTQFGVPLQLMASLRETGFGRFLELQSEILEQIIQLAPRFRLQVFQVDKRPVRTDRLQIDH